MQVNANSDPVELPMRRPQVAPLNPTDSFSAPSFYKQLAKLETPLASDWDPSTVLEVGMPPRVVDAALARAAKMRGDGVMHVRVRSVSQTSYSLPACTVTR